MILYRLLSWLPFPLLYGLAWVVYLLLYHVARYRRATVRQNLARAFPEKSSRERAQLGKQFYRQFCQVALEIVKARRMSKADFSERVTVLNPELLREYSNDFKQSVLVLTIHQGNWEWMLHGVSIALGVPMDPVYKPLHSKTTNKLIYEIRNQFGSQPLSMAESTRDIVRRRREFRLLVMVADQSPIRRERSYWTQFMHRSAAFYLGTEVIARMAQLPVVFAQCRRRGTGRYEVEFHALGQPPYPKDSHQLMESYVRMAEQCIRSEPQSWLWSNRRWKRQSPAEAP
jgi:KDO2-lipid IV(A) lauroyltransferase